MVGATPSGTWRAAATGPAVRAALARAGLLCAVHVVDEAGSTQDVGRALAAADAPDGTVVVAERQTAGRGRRGRRWEDDPRGGGLALTLVLDVATVGTGVGLVPHALGVAVRDACATHVTVPGTLGLKWPNDVVVRRDPSEVARKLAGVLVERERVSGAAPREVLLCGIGLNVAYSGEVPADRVDLASIGEDLPGRDALLAALVVALDRSLALLARSPGALVARYRDACETIGRAVVVDGAGTGPSAASTPGTAVGIDDEGRLLVSHDGMVRAILSGTVRDREESE